MRFDAVWRLFQEIFGIGPFCLLRVMRGAVGLSYGHDRFAAIVSPYWERGHGTTCAVVLGWALERCGWKGPLNRKGRGWNPPKTIGQHMAPILEFARERGALEENPSLDSLLPGDVIYLEGATPNDWHVGVVEKNLYPNAIITLDGGQSDKRGEQSIARVERPISDNKLGPFNFRRVKLVIRAARVL